MEFVNTVNPSEDLYLKALDVINWHDSDKSSNKGSDLPLELAESIVYNYQKKD